MISKINTYKFLSLLIVALTVLPVLISICFIVPGADDFCNGLVIENLREDHNLLSTAIIFSKNLYLGWQGTYLAGFFIGFHPNIHDSYFLLRAILFCSFVLFVFGAYLFVQLFSNIVLKFNSFSSYVISAIFTILILNTSRGGEWFTWLSGSAVYEVPMICYFYSLIFFILFYKSKNVYLLAISLFLSFIAAGGSLAITSLGSSLLLLSLLFIIEKNQLLSRKNLILSLPFIMSVTGGLINSFAPGNFRRHLITAKTEDLQVFKALKFSFLSFFDHFVYLNKFAIVFFWGFLFITIYKNEKSKISLKKFLLLAILGLISVILVAFPVFLGYSFQNLGRSSRFAYAFDIEIIFYSVAMVVALASYLRNTKYVNMLFAHISKLKKATVMLIVVVCLICSFFGIKNGYAYKTFRDLRRGNIQEATASLTYIYSTLASSKNQDVVLSVKPVHTSSIYLSPIGIDPSHWINTCTSNYFGAKSCIVNYDSLK